jgi:hypothetical protein
MSLDLSQMSANQDLLLAGGGYLLLKNFGILDMVKSKLTSKASNASVYEKRDQILGEIHAMGERAQTAAHTAAVEQREQTTILKSVDSSLRELLTLRRNGV